MADNNIYRRGKKGIFWGRTWVDGRERRQSLRTSDRSEAKKRLAAWKVQLGHASFYGENRLTWEAAVVRYCEEVMAGGVKDNTADRYKVSFRAVDPYLRGKWMDSITKADIARVIGQRKKGGVSNASVRRDLSAMSGVFAAAISWGACEHNIPLEYDRRLVRERRDPIVLPADEAIAIAIGLAPAGLGRMIGWALTTGMRQDELLRLEWPDVNLERRAILLSKTKTDQPRVVPLDEAAIRTITGTKKREGCRLVMWHGPGLPYANFASQFRAWRVRAGVGFRFHDLRHKFAVEYLRRGGNIYDLQQILGHASVKTTEGYLRHLTPDERRVATGTKTGTSISGLVVPFDQDRVRK